MSGKQYRTLKAIEDSIQERGGGGGGRRNSHMKRSGMFVENFELTPPLKETNVGVVQALFDP